jgi:hypothetical protein
VKIDAASSTPYLIVRPSETLILTFSYPDLVYAPNKKFCTAAFNTNCCILVTDTKKTWAEGVCVFMKHVTERNGILIRKFI